MQKALTQMNIRLANVISDISGVTGQAILKAILDGERDPRELAAYRDCRIEASEEEIAQALEGNWQEVAVSAAAGTSGIRVLPATDNGVRSAAGTLPRPTRGSDPGGHSAGRDSQGTAQEKERQSTI
jgi:hypothetical protein